jgi:hypothetical protein
MVITLGDSLGRHGVGWHAYTTQSLDRVGPRGKLAGIEHKQALTHTRTHWCLSRRWHHPLCTVPFPWLFTFDGSLPILFLVEGSSCHFAQRNQSVTHKPGTKLFHHRPGVVLWENTFVFF